MVTTSFVLILMMFQGHPAGLSADPESGASLVAKAGISPEVLAAAGCTGETARAVAVAVQEDATDLSARTAALNQLISFNEQLADADHRLSTNPRDEEAFRNKIVLQQGKKSALDSLSQAEHALRVHSLSTVPEQTAAMIEAGARSRGYNIPGPVRVAMPADSDWKLVAGAVRARQRAARIGTPVPDEFSSMAQSIDGNSVIATAAQNYQANIAAVRAALAATIDPNNP